MNRVQQEPFEVGLEIDRLKKGNSSVGGTVVFVGTVRDLSDDRDVTAMTLEHYPGMTEKALDKIESDARSRWQLEDILIIHRFGVLKPSDDIVLIIVTSAHRSEAFDACHFLIDWLKTKAPFWKLETGSEGESWVVSKANDDAAAERWN